MANWADASAIAVVIPGGAMPQAVNGIPIAHGAIHDGQWKEMAQSIPISEPEFVGVPGKKKSAGVIIRERDGRVWLVAPTNAFGGYKATFPKGRLDGRTPKEAALVEAFEETGLIVRLVRHLVDVPRTTTVTRYYLAERVAGNPSNMGWESQAVMLVPETRLHEILNHPKDHAIVEALRGHNLGMS